MISSSDFLTLVAAVGSAASAGVFFTFSTFTMAGLRRLQPTPGATAMQAINREAPKPPLMLLLFGTAAVCAVLMVAALLDLDDPRAKFRLLAGALYILGAVILTGLYHVPRNNRLEAVDPTSRAGMDYWQIYLREWVRMNHWRTLAPLVAALLLVASLIPE
ncbi:MAG: anthrone oxygenase family protein [Acidobacteriota bacterium]